MGIRRQDLRGTRVAVLGAGGAARAIVAAFAWYGATVVIYNRTFEKAQALAEEFDRMPGEGGQQGGKVVAARFEKLCDCCCEVYINATPLGMHPDTDNTPLPSETANWSAGTVVFDTIYNPVQTRLLREAREAGCVTISGLEMFVRQACGQFERWTQQPAPADQFEAVVRNHLEPASES
jgi:shikimate dehydrogenase